MAAYSGDIITVEAAIEAKVDLDATDKNGLTALHWAAMDGHSNVVMSLLREGASSYIKDKHGRTAAQVAASKRHGHIVSILQEFVAVPAASETQRVFVLPPLELLNESPPKPVILENDARKKQAVLIQTLNRFEIGAYVAQVTIGPTFTRYEVQLESDILVKKTLSLADNLALSLVHLHGRIEG